MIGNNADIKTQAALDLDRLMSQRNYRQIYNDQGRYLRRSDGRSHAARAVGESADRHAQTASNLMIAAANGAEQNGNVPGAWEGTVENAFKPVPGRSGARAAALRVQRESLGFRQRPAKRQRPRRAETDRLRAGLGYLKRQARVPGQLLCQGRHPAHRGQASEGRNWKDAFRRPPQPAQESPGHRERCACWNSPWQKSGIRGVSQRARNVGTPPHIAQHRAPLVGKLVFRNCRKWLFSAAFLFIPLSLQ